MKKFSLFVLSTEKSEAKAKRELRRFAKRHNLGVSILDQPTSDSMPEYGAAFEFKVYGKADDIFVFISDTSYIDNYCDSLIVQIENDSDLGSDVVKSSIAVECDSVPLAMLKCFEAASQLGVVGAKFSKATSFISNEGKPNIVVMTYVTSI